MRSVRRRNLSLSVLEPAFAGSGRRDYRTFISDAPPASFGARRLPPAHQAGGDAMPPEALPARSGGRRMIPVKSDMPKHPGVAAGVIIQGHLPAHTRTAIPTRAHHCGGPPNHNAPTRRRAPARPPPGAASTRSPETRTENAAYKLHTPARPRTGRNKILDKPLHIIGRRSGPSDLSVRRCSWNDSTLTRSWMFR